MLLACGNCGAPLDVNEGATIVTCGYCRVKTERARLRTLAESTPGDFKPPKVWRPPPEVPAPSDVELSYRGKSYAWIYPVLLVTLIVGFLVVRKANTFDADLATLLGKPLDGTAKELAGRIGGTANDNYVNLAVKHPDLESVYFSYDRDRPDHPATMGIRVSKGRDISAACARLVSRLGAFRDHHWSLGELSVHCAPDGKSSYVAARPGHSSGDRWKKAFAVLRTLFVEALLDRKSSVGDDELQATVGAGYSLEELTAFDPKTDFDRAEDALAKTIPGALKVSDTDWSVGFRHQLVQTIRFEWDNKAHGELTHITLVPMGWGALGNEQATLARCLQKTLGQPKIEERDHAKKTVNYIWERGAPRVWLYDSSLSLVYPDKATYQAVLVALGKCP